MLKPQVSSSTSTGQLGLLGTALATSLYTLIVLGIVSVRPASSALVLTPRYEGGASRDGSQDTGVTLFSQPQPVLLPQEEHV